MFSFIAYVVGAVFVARNWPYVVAALVAIIAFLMYRHRKKKKQLEAYLALPVIYVGNKSTHTFHRPGCSKLSSLAPANTVYFRVVEENRRYGYTPCNICKP